MTIRVLVSLFILILPFAVHGQKKPLSPRDSVFLSLDTNKISVNYSRPSMRGREIMGELVPWNKVWRTGANQATTLTTNFDMVICDVPLVKGKYSLWTLPSPGGWKMILNKETGQWGTDYDPGQDYARFDVVVSELPAAIETLTVALEPTGPASGNLRLMWEKTMITAPFRKEAGIRPVSPTDSAAVRLGDGEVKVRYSRPFIRGRSIWGVVVPYDSVWRTGANAATVLSCGTDVMLGDTRIPKGTYTLYSIPSERSLTLIVSKKGPGRAQYDKDQDLARIELKRNFASTIIDPFRMWFEEEAGGTQRFNIGWADRLYSVTMKAGQ
jgi:hypothetical protein